MNFAQAMYREGSVKTTENGAFAYETAGNGALLDLFAQIGALRPRTEAEICNKFAAAFRENNLLATKMLFYAGDIRQGGLGERRTFKICLRWLAENHPEIVIKNIELIPYFNRFDSWFVLVGTKCENEMWKVAAETLAKDMAAMKSSRKNKYVPVSLLAKWMPSENASSKETRKMANKAMRALELEPRKYRKMLSALRKHINIVERQMSEGKWSEIDYSKVPSYAMHNYGSAFAKHDYERFNAYLQSLKKGETKINASTLYPYDLVGKYLRGYGFGNTTHVGDCWLVNKEDAVVEAQWKALPNYMTKPMNAVVMADVSGSMTGRPMATSIGLATYFAQHNTGWYHNQYMTFTSKPKFVNLTEGASLYESVKKVAKSGVGYSTNLEAAFKEILDTAVYNHVPADEMPEALVVISDMEIDRYMRAGRHWDFLRTMEAKFEAKGYKLPKIILWNVEARKDTFLTQSEDVIFISGQSIAAFRHLCQNLDGVTAYEMMLRVLNSEAYDRVVI
jgi:hypothetical protein